MTANDVDVARRTRLRVCVEKLGRAIAAGTVTPAPLELEVLAAMCVEYGLLVEAGRVRRWGTG